jgi:hypothetical protein
VSLWLRRRRTRAQGSGGGGGTTPDAGQTTFVNGTFAPAANGSATAGLTYTSRSAGGSGIPGRSIAYDVVYTAVDVAASSVAASPSTVDSGVPSTITITLLDATGEPLVGVPASQIVVASSGTGNTITQPSGVTSAAGQITATLSSTVGEAKTISVTACGVLLSDTAEVTVSGGGGGGATWRGNEPAGLTNSTATDFSTSTAWSFTNGSHGSVSGENQAATSPPRSGPLVARFQCPTGSFSGGGIGIATAFTGQNVPRVYTCAWLYVSPNATLHPSAWKLWYQYNPGGSGGCVPLLEPIGSITSGGIRLKVETQAGRTPPASAASSPTVGVITRGQWFLLETLTDATAAVFRAWVDGVEVVTLTGGTWSNTQDCYLDPYYGGETPGHTVGTDSHILCDAAYVSWGA